MAELRVDVTRQPGATVVRIAGRAGSVECEHLEEQLAGIAGSKPGAIVLDLTALEFMSSVGVSAILALHRAAKGAGSAIRIACDKPLILQLLKTVRLDEMMPVRPTLAEAMKD